MIAEKRELFFSFNMDLKMYTELLATYLLPQAAMHGAILLNVSTLSQHERKK